MAPCAQETPGFTLVSTHQAENAGRETSVAVIKCIEIASSMQNVSSADHEPPQSGDRLQLVHRDENQGHSGGKPDNNARGGNDFQTQQDRKAGTATGLDVQPNFVLAPPISPARQILSAIAAPAAELINTPLPPTTAIPMRQLQIVMRPEHLGTINVTLRLEGKCLLVTIEADKPDTANVLRHDKTMLDGIVQGIAADSSTVTITVRDADLASTRQPQDTLGGGSSANASNGNGSESRSSPDKAPGAKLRQMEEPPLEEHQAPDPVRLGVVVI